MTLVEARQFIVDNAADYETIRQQRKEKEENLKNVAEAIFAVHKPSFLQRTVAWLHAVL